MLSSLRTKREQPPPPRPRSEQREALAAAIERRNDLTRELDAVKTALENARAGSRAAKDAIPAARAAVERAKVDGVTHLTAVAMGTAGEPPLSVKDARASLQEEQDKFEMQETALAGLEDRKTRVETALDFARSAVKQKLQDVCASEPSFRNLFEEYESLRRQAASRQLLLGFLFSVTPRDFPDWQATRQFRPGELQDETGPWRAALSELEQNPDAPLPGDGGLG
jgi:hypothetical protein